MRKREIELLAPAGNIDSFKAAVNTGADAVYMGLGKHNARVMAKNFTLEDYIYCLDYAHIRGVKVYLTLNTLVKDNEIREALELLISLYSHGLDAVILQDIGLASIIKKLLPDLPLHASTQMSAYSLEQVKYLESIGFSRVVLARELTLKEIKHITDNTNVEIEAFVHGALCVSVSGQCLLSLSIGNRSANRGACAQPCRMKYSLANSNGIVENNSYILSKKDIFGLDILEEILDANFLSLKIEGRNKSPEYVATVISLYRKYIDKYKNGEDITISKADEKMLLQVFNRNGKSNGYLKGINYKKSITLLTPKNTGLYLGKVIDKKGNFAKVKVEEEINLHDGVEIHYNNSKISSTIVTCIKDTNNKIINSKVMPGNEIYIGDFKDTSFNKGDNVYKTSSSELNSDISKRYIKQENRKRELVLNVDIKPNSPITLSTIINGKMYIYNTNEFPEESINKEINLEDIYSVFSKTQENGVKFTKVVGFIEKGLFIKVSKLNEIRRNFVSKVESKYIVNRDCSYLESKIEEVLTIPNINYNSMPKSEIISIYKYNGETNYKLLFKRKYNKDLKRIYFQIDDYIKYQEDINNKYKDLEHGVIISNFTLDNIDTLIRKNIESILNNGVKYVILGSFRYIELLKKLKEKYSFCIIADYSFNICNSYGALFMMSQGIDIITPAFDADEEQIENLSKVTDIELVDNYLDVMTSRYCILGSFVANREVGQKCSGPCMKDDYYILDIYNEKYPIICNNKDCTMKILKKYKNNIKDKYNVRRNEI